MLKTLSVAGFTHLVTRNPSYNQIQARDLTFFRSVLSSSEIITQDLEQFNIDYTRKYKGSSSLVLVPSSLESMQNIMRYCNQNMLAIVPQGGNTGLVGGNVPVFDEVVVSTRSLNKVEGFDQVSSILSCQAGCILENLNQYLSKFCYQIPLDLGAKGSCHIGGNISTHAGGKYFIKYGPLRGNVLGIEAVLANGEVLNLRSKLRKDNTGIDLKQLFIGSEGSLGIITSLDIQCVKVDQNKMVILIKTKSFEDILKFTEKAKMTLGKNLNSLEYMDGYAYNVVFNQLPFTCPMPLEYNQHSLLMEINGQAVDLLDWIPQTNQSIVSNNQTEYNSIWKIRESIAEAANRQGVCYKYDVSFDVSLWGGFILNVRQKLRGLNGYVMGYGHIGDGNLHINVCLDKSQHFDQLFILEEVVKHNGSISAEHGMGQHKARYLSMQKQQRVIQLGREIKRVFDPNLILNPYKLYSG